MRIFAIGMLFVIVYGLAVLVREVSANTREQAAARPAEPEPLTVSAGLSDLRVRAVGTVMHDEITWNVCQVLGFTLRETYGMVWRFDGQTVRAFIFTDPASDSWRPSEAETLDTAKHFLSAGGAK